MAYLYGVSQRPRMYRNRRLGSLGAIAKGGYGYVTGSTVNLRLGPSTSYSVRGTLSRGDVVMITQNSLVSKGWYGVKTSSGQYGWISSSYISATRPGGTSPTPSGDSTKPGDSTKVASETAEPWWKIAIATGGSLLASALPSIVDFIKGNPGNPDANDLKRDLLNSDQVADEIKNMLKPGLLEYAMGIGLIALVGILIWRSTRT